MGEDRRAVARAILGAITSVTAKNGTITEKQREFWSFQPLKTVTPPRIED